VRNGQIGSDVGPGNVGRGIPGPLFSESGYEVIFVDVDGVLIDALNSRQSYTNQLVDNQVQQAVTIAPVRALLATDAAPSHRRWPTPAWQPPR